MISCGKDCMCAHFIPNPSSKAHPLPHRVFQEGSGAFLNFHNPTGFLDIGSNSIRTMTVTLVEGRLHFSNKSVHTTRLAEGLLHTGRLSKDAMARSLAVIADFTLALAKENAPVYAYATSAVRDANNRDDFLSSIEKLDCAPIGVEVLTGEQEARYAFKAAANGMGGMLDIGGGSSQVVTEKAAYSFPMGCVRARDLCPVPSLNQIRPRLDAALDGLLSAKGLDHALPHESYWTGVGGTITTLAALLAGLETYDKETVSNTVVEPLPLTSLLFRLEALGDERATLPLLKKRHDVILQGGAIVLYFMERLQIKALRVSDADGLEGYAMHIFELSNGESVPI